MPCAADRGESTAPRAALGQVVALRKASRRALANQPGASLISLMRSLANLIPNKKMVDGKGGREGDRSEIQSINTPLGETERENWPAPSPARRCLSK